MFFKGLAHSTTICIFTWFLHDFTWIPACLWMLLATISTFFEDCVLQTRSMVFFAAFVCPSRSQNDLKIVQLSFQWSPKPSKFWTFLEKVALGASWVAWSFLDVPFDYILSRFGNYLAHVLLVFSWIFTHFPVFRRIGVGKGGGGHSFLNHTL